MDLVEEMGMWWVKNLLQGEEKELQKMMDSLQEKGNKSNDMSSTKISSGAMNTEDLGGRQKNKGGSRVGDGGKRKAWSTVGPNRVNKQWNRKRKGDRLTAARGLI